MLKPANYWINHFDLQPHPEGGYFKEMYRSDGVIPKDVLPATFKGNRTYATSIYYLLEQGHFSAFHRIASDEIWHFYYGDPLVVHVIHPDGHRQNILLGTDADKGQVFLSVVPAGCWFGSRPAEGSAYSLVGCTVAPGFDFTDFEMAEREKLIKEFPQHKDLIFDLTR
jgi:predicted cupin superfamily sugar epimerase